LDNSTQNQETTKTAKLFWVKELPMSWVRQEINDHQTAAMSVTPLWNSLRDSIGDAVTEFKMMVSQPGVDYTDCRARGPMCMRVQKPGAFIEIFLSPDDQTIKFLSGKLV
jgi:hypothetical protein